MSLHRAPLCDRQYESWWRNMVEHDFLAWQYFLKEALVVVIGSIRVMDHKCPTTTGFELEFLESVGEAIGPHHWATSSGCWKAAKTCSGVKGITLSLRTIASELFISLIKISSSHPFRCRSGARINQCSRDGLDFLRHFFRAGVHHENITDRMVFPIL